MSQTLPRWRKTLPACIAAAALAAIPLSASAQIVYQFQDFNGANLDQLSQDPTITGACGGAAGGVFTHVPPANIDYPANVTGSWSVDLCGVPTYYCRVGGPQALCTNTFFCNPTCLNGAGVREWEGWSFVNRDFWVRVAGDQNRSQFTLASGNVAVADPDEWDDKGGPVVNCGFYNTFMTTPSIGLAGADLGSLSLSLASSWRPEGFDDADGTNNQTGRIVAIYTTPAGEQTVEVLHWDSNPAGPFFHGDNTNEAVTLSASSLLPPADATAVRFEFSLTNAGNDWWWAVDNLVLSSTASPIALFSENFDRVVLLPPFDETNLPCAQAYCTVPVYTRTGPNGITVDVDAGSTGGVPDWAGWSFTTVPFWNCEGGQSRGQFFLGDGIIAVADGDEWTDLNPNSGTLRTTMNIPAINISRRQGNTLVLGFDNSWRAEPAQTGVITADYQTPSGLQTVEVLRFESNEFLPSGARNPNFKPTALSEALNVPLQVPPAATSVALHFTYVAGNNWWWAIDDLRVFQGVVDVTVATEIVRPNVFALAPSIDYAPCFTPWSPDGPAGWTESNFDPIGCAQVCGRPEWRGWSFANREWWSTNVDDQGRSEFTNARGFVAIADPDEWDDQGNNQSLFDAFLTSPEIPLPASFSTIAFELDSSWRPEGFDDGVNPLATQATGIGTNQNNQTASIKAIYSNESGPVGTVQILNWDSDRNSPNFRPDDTNAHLIFTGSELQVPAGATRVKFEFGMTKARNDWWWAVDNLALKIDGNTTYTEGFENPTALQTAPTEQPPTTLCIYYSTVAQQLSGYVATNTIDTATCGGQPDFQGWGAWLTDAWARAGGGARSGFSSRTAYVSDFGQLGCPGTATLTSPDFDVRVINPGTLTLSFRSGWLNEVGHSSKTEVSFNAGATWTTVLDWTSANKPSNPDEVVTVQLNNAAGAQTVRVRFVDSSVEAGAGYWAINEIAFAGQIGTDVCEADYNFDGNVDPDDLSDAIACFFDPTCELDFDGNSVEDPDDLSTYISVYFSSGGGC